jgi:beta-lactamase class A
MNQVTATLASILVVINQLITPVPHEFISPVPANYVVPPPPKLFPNKNEQLKKVVEKALEETTGKYAVVVKNLKTKTYFAQNENELMHAASLYKSWLVTAVYEDIRDGKLDENQVLTESIPGINSYFSIAPADQELSHGTINMTVRQLVEQTITISHNYTALTLLKNIGGYDRIEKILDEFGLKNSTFKIKPQTTAADMEIFLEQLYNHKIGDELISEKLIEVMSRNKLNDGLPKYLPAGIKVAHKTGEIYGFKHDAGIVYTPNGDYLIVVMSESNSPFGAEERIAQVSRAVYDYFQTVN